MQVPFTLKSGSYSSDSKVQAKFFSGLAQVQQLSILF